MDRYSSVPTWSSQINVESHPDNPSRGKRHFHRGSSEWLAEPSMALHGRRCVHPVQQPVARGGYNAESVSGFAVQPPPFAVSSQPSRSLVTEPKYQPATFAPPAESASAMRHRLSKQSHTHTALW
eukprot:TRINITY_DN6300_c0_g1_i1.p1 TRINITY_DN6300_c0_g1~~TRINITY_DN6300_c0_g1_i1.p1  ORF type:complete len:125 (-),score=17.21 TRINITY_DN6300_c0_g1_i1:104-478(-)